MHMTNREQILKLLTAYAKDPGQRSSVGRFIQMLSTDQEDQLTCQECEELLPEYIQAEQDGTADQSHWAAVTFHLQTCPHCTNEYTEISALLTLGLSDQGPEPPYYPTPDLSFLHPSKSKTKQPQASFWHLDEVGRLIIQLVGVLWGPLPRLEAAYAVRGGPTIEDRPNRLGQISIGEPAVEDLQVDVTVLPAQDDPSLCKVVARVEVPSRFPNLAGTEVTLTAGARTITELTNESGEVTFRKVPLESLPDAVLRVTY
jgi:hypothetical protein